MRLWRVTGRMKQHSIRTTRRRILSRALPLVVLGLMPGACGGGSPSSPTPSAPAITVVSVTPTSGTTAGGTEVTITGTGFVTGATATIGGVATTNVRVLGTTSIVAVTGARAAGAADVVVTQDTRTATLAAAYTYVAPPVPTVTAVTPASGSTAGGTQVTITGTNFADVATVAIGGVAASSVAVVGPTTIRAVTGPRAAGAAAVAVTVNGQTGTLASGFTYVAPSPNTLPVIVSLAVQGTRPEQPANYADLGEELVLTAVVQDAETPISQLEYEWSAGGGIFTGTGPVVRWRAPAVMTTPAQLSISLKVTEVIAVAGGGEGAAAITQSVTATTTVRVHDSLKEVRTIADQFLLDFSISSVAPAHVVRNFWDGCPGKADELVDVQRNRDTYLINSYQISSPTYLVVSFKGTCPFRQRKGDACVQTPVVWRATDKGTGKTETATGLAQTSAVYRDSRWWLCDSDFDGVVTNPIAAIPFIR